MIKLTDNFRQKSRSRPATTIPDFILVRKCLHCMSVYLVLNMNCLLFRSTCVHSRILVGFVLLDLQFYVYVLQIVVCPFLFFLLVIVLSVLLRFTPSDYLCGIFKFFLLSIVYVYFFIQKQQMNIVLIQYKNCRFKTVVHFCQIFDQIVVVVLLYLDDLFAIHLCCVQQYML